MLNLFLYDIFLYMLLLILSIAPNYILTLEPVEDTFNIFPNYYNLKLQGINECIDELLDSWSDSAGSDETTDSSSTLVFGSCFISTHVQGVLSYIPMCTNPCADLNIILIFIEDCTTGILVTMIPIIGFRTYAECLTKDIPAISIPVFVFAEIGGQTARIISLALRMVLNVTAGHNLFLVVACYAYTFIVYTVKLQYQLVAVMFILGFLFFIILDIVIATVQSYVLIIIETFYELDSE